MFRININFCFMLLIFCFVLVPAYGQGWEEAAKLVAADRSSSDNFGFDVAIAGNFALVGAYGEDEDHNGTNSVLESGSVYIFKRNGIGVWEQFQKINATDRGTYDWFGWSVAIAGNVVVVGAPHEDHDSSQGIFNNPGSVYVYEQGSLGRFQPVQKLIASDRSSNANFGFDVAVSGDYIIVGAPVDDLDSDGTNDSSDAGSAYIYERQSNGQWLEVEKITAVDRQVDDRFGLSVSISGNYALVGSPWESQDVQGMNKKEKSGSVYFFKRSGSGNWQQSQKIVAPDRGEGDLLGYSVCIAENYAIAGALEDADDESGQNAVIGAGSAYIIEFDGNNTWDVTSKLVASDRSVEDNFGFSVSISGAYAVIGAFLESEDAGGGSTLGNAGSAYVFERGTGGLWAEADKLVSSDRESEDWFGYSVAIWQHYIMGGALKEDHDTAGANQKGQAGSAYVFNLTDKLGVHDVNLELFKFYPNPTSNKVQLDFGQPIKDVKIEVMDSKGQIVQIYTALIADQLEITLPDELGVYFVKLVSEENYVKQIVVVKY